MVCKISTRVSWAMLKPIMDIGTLISTHVTKVTRVRQPWPSSVRKGFNTISCFLSIHFLSSTWIISGVWPSHQNSHDCKIKSSIYCCVKASLMPEFICSVLTLEAIPKQAVASCFSTSAKISDDEHGVPAYWKEPQPMDNYQLDWVSKESFQWTWKNWWKPSFDSFSFCEPPTLHFWQEKLPWPPMCPQVSLCEGLSPGPQLQWSLMRVAQPLRVDWVLIRFWWVFSTKKYS